MNRKMANVFLIILIAVCFYFVMGNSSRIIKNKYQKEYDDEMLAVQIHRDADKGGYRLINSIELGLILKKGNPVLIDTRSAEEFKKNYIEGAVNFSLPKTIMDNWNSTLTGGRPVSEFVGELGRDKKRLIVFYGKSLDDRSSHNGARWAVTTGYENVLKLCGGINSYRGAGMKIIYNKTGNN